MNTNQKELIRAVCESDMKKAQTYAKIILNGIDTKTDAQYKNIMLRKLANRPIKFLELPYNVQGMLVAEDSSNFRSDRFLERESEKKIVSDIMTAVAVSERLADMGISYTPSCLLFGESGTGKTELARYIAYKLGVPFVYVKFSCLIDSALGKTQTNVGKVFEYAKANSCVLCLDELDAIGAARGQVDDVKEMSRITISIMQEMDNLKNNMVVIGTTNRIDIIDNALIRRFPIRKEITALSAVEANALMKQYINSTGIQVDVPDIYDGNTVTPATVVKDSISIIIDAVKKDCSANHNHT